VSRKKRPAARRPPHPKGLVYFLKDGRLISPLEQLENLLDGLWDDELLGTEVEIDERCVEEAREVVQAAINKALAARPQESGNKRRAEIVQIIKRGPEKKGRQWGEIIKEETTREGDKQID